MQLTWPHYLGYFTILKCIVLLVMFSSIPDNTYFMQVSDFLVQNMRLSMHHSPWVWKFIVGTGGGLCLWCVGQQANSKTGRCQEQSVFPAHENVLCTYTFPVQGIVVPQKLKKKRCLTLWGEAEGSQHQMLQDPLTPCPWKKKPSWHPEQTVSGRYWSSKGNTFCVFQSKDMTEKLHFSGWKKTLLSTKNYVTPTSK